MEKNVGNIHNTDLEDGEMSLSHGKVWNLSPSLHAESLFILTSLTIFPPFKEDLTHQRCRFFALHSEVQSGYWGLPWHRHVRRRCFSFNRTLVRRTTSPSCDTNQQNGGTSMRGFWVGEGRHWWRLQTFFLLLPSWHVQTDRVNWWWKLRTKVPGSSAWLTQMISLGFKSCLSY